MTTAVRFQVVDAGRRRFVDVSPATRPELRLPQAHPSRGVAARGGRKVNSCLAVRPARRESPWLVVKIALVGLVAVAGGALSVGQLVADATAEPSGSYVAGDPAWAHVQP